MSNSNNVSIDIDHRLFNRLDEKLSRGDKSALLSSWQSFGGESGRCAMEAGTKIFDRLSMKNKVVFNMFTEASRRNSQGLNISILVQRHARYMTELIHLTVMRLNGIEQLNRPINIAKIGCDHASLSQFKSASPESNRLVISKAVWEEFGNITAEIFANHQVNRSQRIRQRVWTTLIAILIDELQHQFTQARLTKLQQVAPNEGGARFYRAVTTVHTVHKWRQVAKHKAQHRQTAQSRSPPAALPIPPTFTQSHGRSTPDMKVLYLKEENESVEIDQSKGQQSLGSNQYNHNQSHSQSVSPMRSPRRRRLPETPS